MPVVRDVLTEWGCIISILFLCWLSVSFSSTGGERARTGHVRKLCVLRCFQACGGGHVRKPCALHSFRGCGERSVWIEPVRKPCVYRVCGVAKRRVWIERVREQCVLRCFRVAERSIWAGHVGGSTSTGQWASSSRRMLLGSPTRFVPSVSPPCPGRRPAGVSLYI